MKKVLDIYTQKVPVDWRVPEYIRVSNEANRAVVEAMSEDEYQFYRRQCITMSRKSGGRVSPAAAVELFFALGRWMAEQERSGVKVIC